MHFPSEFLKHKIETFENILKILVLINGSRITYLVKLSILIKLCVYSE